MLVIFLNTVAMASRYSGMNPDHARYLDMLNTFSTWFFTIELVLKYLGIGRKEFFKDSWCEEAVLNSRLFKCLHR